MKKSEKNTYVTKGLFVKELNKLDSKMGSVEKRLDHKIDRVALSLIKTQEDVKEIKEKMATKDDINLILNRIDKFVKSVDVHSKKAAVHDYRLNQLEAKVFGRPPL